MNWYIKNSWVLLILAYLPCISQTTILVTVSSGSDSIPLSGVHIINIDNRAGAVTSVNGLAAIIVHDRDTLQFSAIGYKPIQIITQPDHLDFTVYLQEDTILLSQININRQQQLHAKIMEEIPLSRELENANKNISQMQNMYKQGLAESLFESQYYSNYPVRGGGCPVTISSGGIKYWTKKILNR